jgi:hypothetical protein
MDVIYRSNSADLFILGHDETHKKSEVLTVFASLCMKPFMHFLLGRSLLLYDSPFSFIEKWMHSSEP